MASQLEAISALRMRGYVRQHQAVLLHPQADRVDGLADATILTLSSVRLLHSGIFRKKAAKTRFAVDEV